VRIIGGREREDRIACARELLEHCGVAIHDLTDEEALQRAPEIVAAAADYAAATRSTSSVGIAAILDEHLADEFQLRDAAATMTTMTDDPYVNHVAVMTGGVGYQEVYQFYRDHFVAKWPADTRTVPVSRTIGVDQVVDELVVSFTHNIEMDFMLPNVPPTGRAVELPVVVVAGFEDGRLAREHIYWDQASLLVQVGLLDPVGLPVTGVEQARKVLNKSLSSNDLMRLQRGQTLG
jgi:carboxymethylenebutenolidase